MSERTIEYMRPSVLDRVPSDGHVIIEASAGTGKTYTIEHLIIDLLRTTAKTIEEILVVTFTEKATAELRGRIRAAIENILRGPSADVQKMGHAWASVDESACRRLEHALATFEHAPIFTIHAFCNRVLTEFAFHSGARFNLELVDGRRTFRTTFRALLRERFAVDPLMRQVLEEWLERKPIDDLENLLYEAHRSRYHGVAQASAIEEVGQALAAKEAIGSRLVTDFYLPPLEQRLERDKRQRGQIDYDDMLAWVWQALEAPGGVALTAILRQRFRFGIVDEFQDTDDLQWQIFKRIFVESNEGNRLFVVGDPKQAIYSFRGADIHSYLGARAELSAVAAPKIPIDQNFRSTASLIDACNLILDQKAKPPLFNGRIKYDHPVKCGVPDRFARDVRGQTIVPITLMRYVPPADAKRFADDAREQLGRFIAATIKRMIADGPDANAPGRVIIDEPDRESGKTVWRRVGARDIFVLTHTNDQCQEIGTYLRAAGVPFAFYRLVGLFQTHEATHVRDVLRAVDDINDRSHRRRAWMSPFFAVKYRDAATIADPPPSHPLNERLYEWHSLAEAERFAELFNRMLHESGLAGRELFLDHDERELTNYSHIFEVLLERAVAGRLSLTEIVELLDDYCNERAEPPNWPDGNIQRLESERDAVQVMTIHMSKGLEADVVMLFGGTHGGHQVSAVEVYHDNENRCFAFGSESGKEAKQAINRERDEEHQRLLYVAMTRARAKLYLPFFPDKSLKLNGPYKHLNDRLKEMVKGNDGATKKDNWGNLFDIADARGLLGASTTGAAAASIAKGDTVAIDQWTPPDALLIDKSDPESVFDRLRKKHDPFRMSSYTSLKSDLASWELTPADFKSDIPPTLESDDLPGGSDVGIFLHEVIERLDVGSLNSAENLESWRKLEPVIHLFRSAMERHQVRDPRWFDRGTELVFKSLTSPIAIASDRTIEALARCRNSREMEFVFPFPEAAHPKLGSAIAGGWVANRGYLKGFIDFVFEDRGLIYFADWKSDLLRAYDSATIADHVRHNYELQARIYTVGVIRLLRIRSEAEYRRRFGGLLYVFLRGVGSGVDPSHGIYFHRPDWNEIRLYEAALMKLGDQG
ncbi:MAG TPA: UvrD-helicase domain-containing protein [Candidatus Binataceae bacterium]